MCNTAYNLKAVFFSLAFLNFGHPFAVTACTHSNMTLKSGGGFNPPGFPLAYTLGIADNGNHQETIVHIVLSRPYYKY